VSLAARGVVHQTGSSWLRSGAAAALGVVVVGGEVAAQTIAGASGGHLGHPLAGLFNPVDGWRWLATLNLNCLLEPHIAHSLNPMQRPGGAIARTCVTPAAWIVGADRALVPWSIGTGILAVGSARLADLRKARRSKGRVLPLVRAREDRPAPLVVELGDATGILHDLGHKSGLRKGQRVRLVGDDVSQDLMFFGGKGQGKTTRGVSNVLLQLFRAGCGGLIVDVKGDFGATAAAIAALAGRTVRVIGVDGEPIDLLADVSPELAASYISSLLLLIGNTAPESTFWNQAAVLLAKGGLGLLRLFPAKYSFAGLYRFAFIADYRKDVEADVADYLQNLEDESERELIESYRQDLENFGKFTDDVRMNARANLSQIIAKFAEPVMEKAFGTPGCSDIRLEATYEAGAIYVVSAPPEHGLAAAAALTFLKLRYYSVMNHRRVRKDCDQSRRVALVIDECHEVAACSADGMSDTKFLATSRDTGNVCVWATQSVAAMKEKIGDRSTAALLANFRQRVIFRTEDDDTIKLGMYLLGQVEVQRESASETRQPWAWFATKGTSTQPQMQAIADPSVIRNLRKGQALAILSIDGESADDVISLPEPLYFGETRFA
jgi:hypothetical protein